MHSVKVTGQDEKTVRIAGWGVRFGGPDLDGEHFSPDTDFDLDLVPRKPLYYDHSIEDVKHPLGVVTHIRQDELGLWVEAQIERGRKYAREVIALIERGLLGFSSGTAAHLADREGAVIKRWPIIEFSLTPTPAEPRTLGAELIKQFARSNPRLEAALPQGLAGSEAERVPAPRGGRAAPILESGMNDKTYTEAELESASLQAAQETLALAEADIEGRVAMEVKRRFESEGALKEAAYLKAPAFNRTGLGDSEAKAFAHYVRSGDDGRMLRPE